MKKLLSFLTCIFCIYSCNSQVNKNFTKQSTYTANKSTNDKAETDETKQEKTENTVINEEKENIDIKSKYALKDNLSSDDILRYNYKAIIKSIDKNINLDGINFDVFKVEGDDIIFGDDKKLILNIEKFERVFKPFTGLPSLYKGEEFVIAKRQLDMSKKHIAFTFDDGPVNQYHDLIRDLFDSYNQKASFCVIGKNVKNHPDKLIKTYKMGHEIINHTTTHPHLPKLSNEKIFENVQQTSDLIMKYTGYDVKYVRPPYGDFDKRVKEELNGKLAMWNVDSEDWKSRNVDTIIKRVLPNVKDLDIVLFHDLYKESYESVKYMLPILIDQGYEFVTYSEMIELRKEKVKHKKLSKGEKQGNKRSSNI